MIRFLVRLILRLLHRVEVQGKLPSPLPSRLLIISNHQSFLDPLLIGAFLDRDVAWVVHSEIYALWYFRWIIRLTRHVVVDTNHPQAIRTLVHAIEEGVPVMIFPEGRLTMTGGLMKVYDGPAFLAAKTGAAVLAMAIDGAVYTPFSRMTHPFPRRLCPRIRITIRPLEYLPMPEGRTGKERRRLASNRMHRMLEEAIYHGRRKTTIHEAFLEAARLYGENSEILDDVRRMGQTYRDLLKAALALGRLCSRLAAEGETVGVLMPNAGVTVGLLLGMLSRRRIPAMLNYSAGVEGMQAACDAARVTTVITSRAFLDQARLTDKASRLTGVRLVCLEDLRARFGLPDKLWLIFWALRFPRATWRKVQPQDPAAVLFTSGSEGRPKGVVLSHDSILANVAQMRAVIEFSNKDKFLNPLPMFHSFGLTAAVLTPLLTGARVWLYPSPLHYRAIPEVAYDRNCTILFGTPAFLARYGQAAHPYDFYRIRYVISGAERLSDEVRQLWLDRFGLRIIEGYGATECSPVISANTPYASRPGTVGRLMPGMECRVVAVPGVPRGGALHVRGDNVMLGYWRHTAPGRLEPPSSELGDGWYDTGDVVEIDHEGFIRILARLKRFAKVAGEIVSLETVERLAGAASARPAAATTRTEPGRGEAIVLFTLDTELRRPQLRARARELGLPELAVPRHIVPLDKLPLMGSGKVDYVRLKEMAEELRV